LIFSEAAMFPDLARFYFDEVVQRGRRLFAGVLRRGIERGEFRPVDVDYTVRVMQAPIVMALIWKHSMVKCQIDPLDFDRHLDVLIDTILNGVVRPSVEPPTHA
jgi:TetR/AcrR family transcriptional regulator